MSKLSYFVRTPLARRRLTEKNLQSARRTAGKWCPYHGDTDNIRFYSHHELRAIGKELVFSKKTKGFVVLNMDEMNKDLPENLPLYQVVPSSTLLYRLVCLYEVENLQLVSSDKSVWKTVLENKNTKEKIMLCDLKGGANLSISNLEEGDFRADWIELMNFLVSDKVPHGYDNLVAGSIAWKLNKFPVQSSQKPDHGWLLCVVMSL